MNALRDLLTNVRAGIRLALMLPVDRDAFRVSVDQIVLLIAAYLAIQGVSLVLIWGLDRVLNPAQIAYSLAATIAILFGCYLTTRVQAAQSSLANVIVLILATGPTMILFRWIFGYSALIGDLRTDPVYISIVFGFAALWSLMIFFRVFRLLLSPTIIRTAALAVLYGVCVMTPGLAVAWASAGMAQASRSQAGDELEPSTVNVEETYYRQRTLLSRSTRALAKERPGVTDLYFLGFGGDARDDVFLKEVRSVTKLFDRRFDTKDRSVMLINHEDTVRSVPLASAHNLYYALRAIGRRMNKDEDVLFLFMTSHGDREHNLAVKLGRLQLNDIPASYIRRALDDTGIKWRVIVVSACFSGGFIDHLKDERTLVMTAARRDRASFGCGDAFDFTYFGQAYFDEALRRTYSFTEAFGMARISIAAREKAEDITPSEPQIFVGDKIRAKLRELEGRFAAIGRATPKSPLTNATAR